MIKDNPITETKFSIFSTILWMLFLALGIQIILGIIIVVGFGIVGVPNDEIELVFIRPDTIAITGLIAAIMSVPLIKTAARQSGKSFPFDFLAFQPINITTLVKVLLAGIGYYAFSALTSYVLSIDTPQFMLDVKSQTHSIYDIFMLVLGICIVAPIVEEVIFRGLAYARFATSRIGVTGAIIVTSLFFAIIHVQYDFIVLAILSPFAFLLGYVRYKTGNLIYCIALHMQLNILSTIELLFFL